MIRQGNGPSVSIIIPAYNTEKYIRKCLDSIVTQTCTDFECIIVDDCSTDATLAIGKEYAEADKRFTVIHRAVNGGAWAAVNDGLKVASAPYILQIDSDDWLENTMVEELLNKAKAEPDADMVVCDFAFDDVEPYHTVIYHGNYASTLSVKEQIKGLILFKVHCGLDYRLVKRKLFDYVELSNNIPTMGGDRYVCTCLLSHAARTAWVNKILYHHCYHKESASNNPAKERKRRGDYYKCQLMIYNYLASQSNVNIADYESDCARKIEHFKHVYFEEGISSIHEFIELYKLSPKARISFKNVLWIVKKIVKLLLPYFVTVIIKSTKKVK